MHSFCSEDEEEFTDPPRKPTETHQTPSQNKEQKTKPKKPYGTRETQRPGNLYGAKVRRQRRQPTRACVFKLPKGLCLRVAQTVEKKKKKKASPFTQREVNERPGMTARSLSKSSQRKYTSTLSRKAPQKLRGAFYRVRIRDRK